MAASATEPVTVSIPVPATNASNGDASPDSTAPVNGAHHLATPVDMNGARAMSEPNINGVNHEDVNGLEHRTSIPVRPLGPHEGNAGGPQSRGRARIHSWDDNMRRKTFPRIAKQVELMRPQYDCIVIGSGYGGGIAASRMARTGMSVCLLERGKERWPGEYPNGTVEAFSQLHVSGDFAPDIAGGKLSGIDIPVAGGNPTGMFHLMFGRGQNALVCNGLGGTSLMNANVFMPADERVLAMKNWPPEISNDPRSLKPYYDKVAAVLEPEVYPDDWPPCRKTELLKKQAEYLHLGSKFKKCTQTTRFKNGPNSCGVEMSASALTGQDCTGANDGSKTTTLVTYLADAWNWGAEMFCECEVRYIEQAKDREGYIVYFAWHGRNRGHFKANLHGDLMWVYAKKAVFLGAGAIGTTEILLRSKAMGLKMSHKVGENMSGNGDIFAFGYNTNEEVNAIGRPYPSPSNPIGPCINGYIDLRDADENPLNGFVIEEGTIPAALAPFLQYMLDMMPGSTPAKGQGILQRTQAALARYGSRFFGPYFRQGALERTQVYLIMSHDTNQAVLTLKNDKPVLEFVGVGRSNHMKHLNNILRRATEAVGGTLVNNPFYAIMGEQEVTVHPIGGASMSRDNTGATGVTDHAGKVFTGRGSEVYPNLIVTDGAVIPTALGANPFATIAALAERAVEIFVQEQDQRQRDADPVTPAMTISEERNKILDLFGEPKHQPGWRTLSLETADMRWDAESVEGAFDSINKAIAVKAGGFGFTEVMSGFIHNDPGMLEDRRGTYELAYRTAKSLCESARFFLSAQTYNTNTTVKDHHHRAMLTGTFICPTIPGSPFMVQRGEFGLFIMSHKAPGTRNLIYDCHMKGVNGKRVHFHGYKVVDSSVALAPFAFWRSTSTLYVTLSECGPHCSSQDINPANAEDVWRENKVLAKGMMHIQPHDFVSEILTMSPTGSNFLKRLASAASFLTFFTRKSLSLFLAPFTPLQYPSQSYNGYINDTTADNAWIITAHDGIKTRLHKWNATSYPDNDKTKVRDLFMIPGASVDHQIFALPTIPFNAVNYFTRAGYNVYVCVHRIGQLMTAENDWTTYDARLDLKASLVKIREENHDQAVYTIAHCMGSVAFASGLLDGTIPADWILGITCSQTFMNPFWNTMNMIKAMAGPIPLDILYKTLAGPWFSCSTSTDDSLVQRCLNQILRFYPDERREICNNASCHRVALVFGRCWNHRNLNEATHRQIDRFFGGVNMTLLHLLMRMGHEGHVMTNGPLFEPLDTPENISRLRNIPFLLFVGRDNAVLSRESTQMTYDRLCEAFGSCHGGGTVEGIKYKRREVPGYGHLDCWMGRNAWKDVYPFVREEVDLVVRGSTYKFKEPDDDFKRKIDSGELMY